MRDRLIDYVGDARQAVATAVRGSGSWDLAAAIHVPGAETGASPQRPDAWLQRTLSLSGLRQCSKTRLRGNRVTADKGSFIGGT